MYWTHHSVGSPDYVSQAFVTIGTNIYVFGGYHRSPILLSGFNNYEPIVIQILDTVKLNWSNLRISDNQDPTLVPTQSNGHSVVAHGYMIYLWGGRTYQNMNSTLYCFNTVTLKWSRPNVYGKIPASRTNHTASVIGNNMYIVGGKEERPIQGEQDLYMLNLSTMTWSIVNTMGNPHLPRHFHSATVINDNIFIFGGCFVSNNRHEDYHILDELYYFDTTTKTWIIPSINGPKPSARRLHSAFSHNGLLYLFGGLTVDINLTLDYPGMYQYNPKTSMWLKLIPKGIPPSVRREMICDVVGDRVIIAGGIGPISKLSMFKTNFSSSSIKYSSYFTSHLNDVHVLDLNPSLKSMCLVNTMEYLEERKLSLHQLNIPSSLKAELSAV